MYRRRLAAANTVVVPICTDVCVNRAAAGLASAVSEADSRWLWSPAEPSQWREYFDELMCARGLVSGAGDGAWLGLNYKGRAYGSALGAPKWDEMLGTALQPEGDGFGSFAEVESSVPAAAAEAAAAAFNLGAVDGGADARAAAAADATSLLQAQAAFYDALFSGDVESMMALFAGAEPDPLVSGALAAGGRAEPWAKGSNAFPPAGMRATDCDVLVSGDVGWSTAVERPREGGTLLATQRWRRAAGGWLLSTHRYIPWSADGATAVTALRCDCRGCCLLGREINTRAA